MAQSQPQQINLTDLDVSQLADVKRQLEEEANHLTNSFAQLRAAQAKFSNCIENVNEVKPKNKDKTILVPLTNSLYIPGKLSDPDHVIVDVGTGYFVQKTRPQATKYYEEKVSFIKKNSEGLEETIGKKKEQLNMVISVLQQKIQLQASDSEDATESKG